VVGGEVGYGDAEGGVAGGEIEGEAQGDAVDHGPGVLLGVHVELEGAVEVVDAVGVGVVGDEGDFEMSEVGGVGRGGGIELEIARGEHEIDDQVLDGRMEGGGHLAAETVGEFGVCEQRIGRGKDTCFKEDLGGGRRAENGGGSERAGMIGGRGGSGGGIGWGSGVEGAAIGEGGACGVVEADFDFSEVAVEGARWRGVADGVVGRSIIDGDGDGLGDVVAVDGGMAAGLVGYLLHGVVGFAGLLSEAIIESTDVGGTVEFVEAGTVSGRCGDTAGVDGIDDDAGCGEHGAGVGVEGKGAGKPDEVFAARDGAEVTGELEGCLEGDVGAAVGLVGGNVGGELAEGCSGKAGADGAFGGAHGVDGMVIGFQGRAGYGGRLESGGELGEVGGEALQQAQAGG